MFTHWRAHFEANRTRPLPAVEAPAPLTPRQHETLTRSLQIFHLGETGEGRIAHQIDQVQYPGVDADYRASLKLFIAEEGRHARILALMVKSLGGKLLEGTWTKGLFTFARRLIDVRFKLMVMLAAEVIALGFYGILSRVLPPGAMASALEQICGDEQKHFDFHCDFLRAQPRVLHWLWWPLGTAAALTVLFDHRDTLRAFGVPLRDAARQLLGFVAQAARQMRPVAAATASRESAALFRPSRAQRT